MTHISPTLCAVRWPGADSPYEQDGVTLKPQPEAKSEMPKTESTSDKKETPEQRWEKATTAAGFQNAFENAAAEAARKKDWAGYNELMKQAAANLREYTRLLTGTKLSQKDLPASSSPVPSENK